ncbi:MAG: hypothetical protein Q9227_007424 [Pyrenula ochraceoflavens]
MSAPNEGRQSPPPERQTGAQLHDPPAGGKAGAAPSETHAQEVSDKTKHEGLESNPTHPLEAAAEEKTKKTQAFIWHTMANADDKEVHGLPPMPPRQDTFVDSIVICKPSLWDAVK